jgi:hypothetical protein
MTRGTVCVDRLAAACVWVLQERYLGGGGEGEVYSLQNGSWQGRRFGACRSFACLSALSCGGAHQKTRTVLVTC